MKLLILEEESYVEAICFFSDLVFVRHYAMALASDLNNDSLIRIVSTYSIEYELEGRIENEYYSWENEHSM